MPRLKTGAESLLAEKTSWARRVFRPTIGFLGERRSTVHYFT
jgi:hypothetical protein